MDHSRPDRRLHCKPDWAGTGQGAVVDILLGVVGAVVGGFIFNAVGGVGITGFNVYSLIVAVVGAIIVLWIYHALSGGTRRI